jgi:hypothetical protein
MFLVLPCTKENYGEPILFILDRCVKLPKRVFFSDGSNELSQHLEASSTKCTRQLIFPDKILVIFFMKYIYSHSQHCTKNIVSNHRHGVLMFADLPRAE